MEKLFYGLTPEQKAEVNERLVELKYDGGLGDFLIQDLRQKVISVRSNIINKKWSSPGMMGLEIPINRDEFAKIEVKHDSEYKYNGEKGVIVVTTKMYQGLEDWYRLQKYLQKEVGLIKHSFTSFEEFVQQYVDQKAGEMELANYEKSLDDEKKELEKPIEVKPSS